LVIAAFIAHVDLRDADPWLGEANGRERGRRA
jgi:hypothetical protein